MSHGEAWEFFLLGKYLERGSQTARILDVKYHLLLPTPEHVGTPIDNAHWMAILTSCSAYEPFHKKRLLGDPGDSVADFLIFDPLFPRSVRFCLGQCRQAGPRDLGTAAGAARQRGRARARRAGRAGSTWSRSTTSSGPACTRS